MDTFSKHFNFIRTIRKYCLAHKKRTIAFGIVVILIGVWGFRKATSTAGEIRYVTMSAQRGSVIVSVTGTGQVSASDQVDLKAKSSGDVVTLAVASGQTVNAGTLIASLDAGDAQKAVRDAEINLASAKLSLAKLTKPADTLDILKAQNTLTQANDTLLKAYGDGYGAVSNAFLDLPTVMTSLDAILHGTDADPSHSGQENIAFYFDATRLNYNDDGKAEAYKIAAEAGYQTARTAYDRNFLDYKALSRTSSPEKIESLIHETYTTGQVIAQAVQNATNLIQLYQDRLTDRDSTPVVKSTTHLASLSSHTSKVNAHLAALLAIQNSISDANLNIPEKTQELQKIKDGADVLDISSAELTVKQRENALLDAREKLADYYIRAPFAGMIAKLSVKKADSVSSGTVIATIITKNKLAEISLNEVDVAKIKTGQKSTLTFDAVPDLSIDGTVAEVDSIGTASQGVVTYMVKVGFATDDDRIKPGMTASAAIVTDMKENVLTASNAAVKSANDGSNYIEVFDQRLPAPTRSVQGSASSVPPRQVPVTIGLSNDAVTEIISGLQEGDIIVSRTISPANAQPAAAAPSIFGGSSGSNRPAAGARIQGR